MLYLLANSPLSPVSGGSAFPNHELSDHEQQTSINPDPLLPVEDTEVQKWGKTSQSPEYLGRVRFSP